MSVMAASTVQLAARDSSRYAIDFSRAYSTPKVSYKRSAPGQAHSRAPQARFAHAKCGTTAHFLALCTLPEVSYYCYLCDTDNTRSAHALVCPQYLGTVSYSRDAATR